MWKILLSMTMVIAFSIAVAASYTAVAHDEDDDEFDDEFTVDVVPDLATFSFVDVDSSGDPTAGDPFIVEGDVREAGGKTVIGHFLCRGYFIAVQADGDLTYVHQSFEFPGMGTIHVEGNESSVLTVLAIDGASGFEVEEDAVLIADPRPDLGLFAFQGTFVGVRADDDDDDDD